VRKVGNGDGKEGKEMIEKLRNYSALILTIAAVIGLPWWFFNYTARYALCEDVKAVKQEVKDAQKVILQEMMNTQKEFNYRFQGIQLKDTEQRLMNFANECKKNPNNKVACDEVVRLQAQQKKEEMELKELGKKK
jgi:hypothetical protein